MAIVQQIALESNRKIRIDFEGGELSSDGGLLLLKEFYHRLGLEPLLRKCFHTTDPALFRKHKDHENLLQMICQITAAYFQDDHADALRYDPALTAAVGKDALASQPTLSRFHNRLDESTLAQLEEIQRTLRDRIYSVCRPEHVLFDLDTTLFAAYGKQEGKAFNYHYQADGYHPLLCFDGMTGDLLKAELRPGATYCCNGAAAFMQPLLEEYQEKYPDVALFLRGDSGFADNKLYRICETNGVSYAIRLKENPVLKRLAKDLERHKSYLTEWIFPSLRDPHLPVAPGAAYQRPKTILKEAGLPDIRFHDLRHTFATHALTGGVDPKTLSGILGHTNASFTLDTYTHVTTDMQQRASEVVGGFIDDLLTEVQ